MDETSEFSTRFHGRLWRFGRADGSTISSSIQFDRRGAILGHMCGNEMSWRLHDGCLEFVSSLGVTTTRFVEASCDADGRFELRGPFLGDPAGRIVHVLQEAGTASPVVASHLPARRNLVVMRAGNRALFPTWARSLTRNWDLAVSFYGDGRPDWGQEYFIAEKGPKWQPIHRWISDNPALMSQYDYVWFPDDDIMTDWDNVNALFTICKDFDLQLAQPALIPDSCILHAVTRQDAQCLLRFTWFVEGMVPVFRADALRLCLPVMQEPSRFGWGHDWIFPMLLGYPKSKIAIIDACAVNHTRPFGQNTDMAVADRECKAITRKFGAKFMDHRVIGRIFNQPEPGMFVT